MASWRNITQANNKLVYRNKTAWKTMRIPPGAYNIHDIDEAIRLLLIENGDAADKKQYISVKANYNTLHSRIILDNGYMVDFRSAGTLRDILGFAAKHIAGDGSHASDRVVNITDVESLQINCSLVTNSYVNGSTSSVLYSLSPDVPPGYLIQVKPPQLLQVDISRRGLIGAVRFFITNQSGNIVDMNNERVTYFLHLTES